MQAIITEKTGGVEQLKLAQIDKPQVANHEVLVEVCAIGINPVDYKVRADESLLTAIYGEKRPAVIGWDIAGTVSEVGHSVSDFKTGDRVFGMVNFPGAGDAYAEYVSAPESQLSKIPEGISFEAAGASTLAALTAYQALKGSVKRDHRILIHAGSGGVGHFAIQIAKAIGAYVITTSSAHNKDFVLSLGADEFIDYRSQKFEEELTDLDFVLDMFNGDILFNSIRVVKPNSSIISLPTPNFSDEILAAARAKNVTVKQIMVQSSGSDMQEIAELLASKKVRPFISNTFDFEEMAKAHLQLESGRTVGKVVVTI
ncbi:MAG: NADP-dependent oxidoreductase [Bacteroidota bacterium]